MEVLADFDNFSRGHFGEDSGAGPGYFGGENFYVTPQGALKIREGTNAVSNTGISNGGAYSLIPKGGHLAVVTVGTSAWGLNVGGGAPTAYGAVYAVSPTSQLGGWCWYGGGSLHTVQTDKIYYAAATSYAGLAGSPGGANVAQLGDRIYVGGFTGGLNNRVRYSDAASTTSWPAGNFFDVGNVDDIIVLIRRQRGSLLIVTQGNSSNSMRWWRFQGTPGINDRLDEITPRGANVQQSDHRFFHCEGYGSRVWFHTRPPDTTPGWFAWVDTDTPHFNGTCRPTNSTLASPSSGATYIPAASVNYPLAAMHFGYGPATVTQRTILLHEETPIGQMVWDYSGITIDANSEFQMIAAASTALFLIAAGGTAAAPPTFQWWGPQFAIDVAPRETDASNVAVLGTVTTPVFRDPQNRIIHVQAVQVDFRWYSANTEMVCKVESSGLEENGGAVLGPQSSTTQILTALGAPGTVGQRARKTFYIGDVAPGNAAQVKLTACKAIAIERIRVLGQVHESQT